MSTKRVTRLRAWLARGDNDLVLVAVGVVVALLLIHALWGLPQ